MKTFLSLLGYHLDNQEEATAVSLVCRVKMDDGRVGYLNEKRDILTRSEKTHDRVLLTDLHQSKPPIKKIHCSAFHTLPSFLPSCLLN